MLRTPCQQKKLSEEENTAMHTFQERVRPIVRMLVITVCFALLVKPIFAAPASPTNLLPQSTEAYPFREAYALVSYGSPTAHALLSVTPADLRQPMIGGKPPNGQFSVDLRIYNDSGDEREFYNLIWSRLIPEPGRLALYDVNKHYVCDLFESMSGSRRTTSAYDWRRIPAFGYIGVTVQVSLPYQSFVVIPPGKYFLQVIYLARAVQPVSASETSLFDYGDNTELFRSNAVPITITSPLSAQSAKLGLAH